VGPTGSGKTTLISLLMRFYEPQAGRILIDGRELSDYDRKRLRLSLGLIQQEVFLFSGSAIENLALGKNLEEATVWFDSFMKQFAPETWDSISNRKLLERANNLSAGEKQLLSFARVAFQKPAVWILDEATSNVDSQSEIEFDQILRKRTQGETTLIVAHRLSTVRDCDLIIVMSRGAIVEQGNHLELMQQKGLYSSLYYFSTLG
jgi:ABC-type multidrug transport system fused ATPase/permease subunit